MQGRKERPKAGETTLFTERDSTPTQNTDYSKRPSQKEMRELDELLLAPRESIDEMAHQNGIFLTAERMELIEQSLIQMAELTTKDHEHHKTRLRAEAYKVKALLVNFETSIEIQYPSAQTLPRLIAWGAGMLGSSTGRVLRTQMRQRRAYLKALERYQSLCAEYSKMPVKEIKNKSNFWIFISKFASEDFIGGVITLIIISAIFLPFIIDSLTPILKLFVR